MAWPGVPATGAVVEGTWRTNLGALRLSEGETGQIEGRYQHNGLPARLRGRLKADGTFDGIWIKGMSEIKCGIEAQGSLYWGRVRIIFFDDRFVGLWSHCGRKLAKQEGHVWHGQIVRPTIANRPAPATEPDAAQTEAMIEKLQAGEDTTASEDELLRQLK